MDRRDTAQVLSILRAAYPNFYSGMGRKDLENIVDLWAAMFADDDPALVAGAVKAFIATDSKGFPPVIGAIKDKLRLITQPEGMSEQEAWQTVYKAICRSGYNSREEYSKLPGLLQSLVGSPEQLRTWSMMDEDTVQSVIASNFMRSYRARAKHQQEFNALPSDVKQLALDVGGSLALEGGGS